MRSRKNISRPIERWLVGTTIGQNGRLQGQVALRRYDIFGGYEERVESSPEEQMKLDVNNFLGCVAQALATNDPKKVIRAVLNKADVNKKDLQGNTALHYVIALDFEEVDEEIRINFLKLLRGLEALLLPNDEGKTPIDIAKDKGYTEIVSLLESPIQLLTKEEKKEFSCIEFPNLPEYSWLKKIENKIPKERSL